MRPRAVLFALPALMGLGGCGAAASDGDWDGPTESRSVAFRGLPEPSLEGTWRDTSGRSTLLFGPGEKLRMKTKTNSPGGARESDQTGRYGVDGDRLFAEVEGKVVEYGWKRKADRLSLKAGRIAETQYDRVR